MTRVNLPPSARLISAASNEPSKKNEAKPKTAADQIPKQVQGEVTLVRSGFRSNQQVETSTVLGKLSQSIGKHDRVAVPRYSESSKLYSTGVSKSQLQGIRQADASKPGKAEVRRSGRILDAAGIDSRKFTDSEKVRTAQLFLESPNLAIHVIQQHPKDIDAALGLAAELQSSPAKSTSAPTQQAQGIREQRLPIPEHIDDSQLNAGRDVGGGHFGDVKLYQVPNNSYYTFVGKTLKDPANPSELVAEEANLAKLPKDHPNLVQSYGIRQVNGEDVLLMEYIKGDSLEKVFESADQSKLEPEERLVLTKHLAKGIFSGLAELQKIDLVHSDVRAANIVLDEKSLEPKLVDFGLAGPRQSDFGKQAFPERWMPPEFFGTYRRDSFRLDTYSAGETLVGEILKLVPMDEPVNKVNEIGFLDTSGSFQLHAPVEKGLNEIDTSGKLADFVKQIMTPNLDSNQPRLRAGAALQHPFLQNPPEKEEVAEVLTKVKGGEEIGSDTKPASADKPVATSTRENDPYATKTTELGSTKSDPNATRTEDLGSPKKNDPYATKSEDLE